MNSRELDNKQKTEFLLNGPDVRRFISTSSVPSKLKLNESIEISELQKVPQ